MNAFTKMVLVPEAEFSSMSGNKPSQPKDEDKDKSVLELEEVLKSNLPPNLKMQIHDQILQKYLVRIQKEKIRKEPDERQNKTVDASTEAKNSIETRNVATDTGELIKTKSASTQIGFERDVHNIVSLHYYINEKGELEDLMSKDLIPGSDFRTILNFLSEPSLGPQEEPGSARPRVPVGTKEVIYLLAKYKYPTKQIRSFWARSYLREMKEKIKNAEKSQKSPEVIGSGSYERFRPY